MKIIYYSDDKANANECKNVLAKVTERDSLITVPTQTVYKDLILNNIIPFNKEVDCIITDSSFLAETLLSPREIVDVTRGLPETVNYSNNDFKVRSIPLVLVIKDSLDLVSAREYGFDAILKLKNNIDEFEGIVQLTIDQVKGWRKKTLNELDDLGIKFNSGIIDYSRYDFTRIRKRIVENLSINFVHSPKKLDYYWTMMETRQIERGIDHFWKLLKQYEDDPSLREEKAIHRFLNKHPYFLKRDLYGKVWYEPYLEDPRTHEHDKEPDFALKPNFSFHTDLSIVEVKLPTEKFIDKNARHPGFYKKTQSYLDQVLNYKEYLESEELQEQILKIFNENPKNIDYKLLIGRKKDKEENQYHIQKKMRVYNLNTKVELLTFDELIELQLRLMDELKLLDVR